MDQDQNSNPLFQFIHDAFDIQASANGEHTLNSDPFVGFVSHATGVNARQLADVPMTNVEFDDMPALQDVSDSESEAASESDRDVNEVEMRAVEPAEVPSVPSDSTPSSSSLPPRSGYTSTPPLTQPSNRRPRVEDDDDEERDRRHPSQRVSSVTRNAASSSSAAPTSSSVTLPPDQPHTHPSAPTAGPSTPQPPAQRPPSNVQRHIFHTSIQLGDGGPANPFRLFQHLLPNNHNLNAMNSTTNTTSNPAPGPTSDSNIDATAAAADTPSQDHQRAAEQPTLPQAQDGRNAHRPPPQLFGGMLSFGIGPGGVLLPLQAGDAPVTLPFPMAGLGPDATQNAQQQQQPGHHPLLADLLARIGAQVLGGNLGDLSFGLDNQEDPERARKLVDGLEVVPEGLVRRLERVGGSGGGMGEDSTKGGDSGCAICWDHLLDTDGTGFGPTEPIADSESREQGSSSGNEKTAQPKIVSLPCAHVFHAECLIPWFSRPRQTTCPTCRFNIDPDNLTYVSWQRRQRQRREAENAAGATNNPSDETVSAATPPRRAASTDGTRGSDPSVMPELPGINSSDRPRGPAGEEIYRQIAALEAHTLGTGAGANRPLRTQQGGATGNDPSLAPVPPTGITVIQLPTTIPISFPVSSDGANTRPTTGTASALDLPAAPTPSEVSGEAIQPQEGQRQQPGSQTGPGLAGDYFRLFTRLGRPSHAPMPLGVLSPPPFRHSGNSEGSTNAPNAANPLPSFSQARRFTLDPLGRLTRLGPEPTEADNASRPTATPNAQQQPPSQTPQQATNTFTMPGLDFGMPGLRADVVVTMDMFFDPRGPPGLHQHGDHDAGEQQPDGDIDMEENIMMMMPEGEEGENPGQEMGGLGEEMLRMLSGVARGDVDNNNANTRNRQRQPQQDQAPTNDNTQFPPLPPFAGMGNGFHMAAGSGRSFGEAFTQLLQRMNGPAQGEGQQGESQAPPQHPPQSGDAAQQQPQQGDPPAGVQPQPQAQTRPQGPRPFFPPGMFGAFPNIFGGPFGGLGVPRPPRHDGPKPAWCLPPPPGPTLRQRVERREREAGLRCYDVSCGLGPSDEDPFTDKVSETVSAMKQLVIRDKVEGGIDVCEHRFHSACLVSAERVALRGADAVEQDGGVGVSCPVCRTAGCVTKEEWDDGVIALES